MSYAEQMQSAMTLPGIGHRARRAAELAADADAEIERLRKREARLFEALKRCERDVQRALRDARNQAHLCEYRVACEAIQQRAAGIGE